MQYRKNIERGILVDPIDEYLLHKYLFYLSEGYPTARVNGKYVKLHKLILTEKGCKVDHKNRDRRDNRRDNLRYVTDSQNARNSSTPTNNTSGYRGVSWNTKGNWGVQIRVDTKIIRLGTFIDKEVAARAYDAAAIKYHGEFAVLNFPER